MKHVTIHNPLPRTKLPAHEQSARRARTQRASLPAIPRTSKQTATTKLIRSA